LQKGEKFLPLALDEETSDEEVVEDVREREKGEESRNYPKW